MTWNRLALFGYVIDPSGKSDDRIGVLVEKHPRVESIYRITYGIFDGPDTDAKRKEMLSRRTLIINHGTKSQMEEEAGSMTDKSGKAAVKKTRQSYDKLEESEAIVADAVQVQAQDYLIEMRDILRDSPVR